MNRLELIFRISILTYAVVLAYLGFPHLAAILLIGSLIGYVRR